MQQKLILGAVNSLRCAIKSRLVLDDGVAVLGGEALVLRAKGLPLGAAVVRLVSSEGYVTVFEASFAGVAHVLTANEVQ